MSDYAIAIRECKEALEKARDISRFDEEAGHSNADDAICKLLIDFGLAELVDIYNSVDKWYS